MSTFMLDAHSFHQLCHYAQETCLRQHDWMTMYICPPQLGFDVSMRFFWLRHNVSFQVKKNDDFMLSRAC